MPKIVKPEPQKIGLRYLPDLPVVRYSGDCFPEEMVRLFVEKNRHPPAVFLGCADEDSSEFYKAMRTICEYNFHERRLEHFMDGRELKLFPVSRVSRPGNNNFIGFAYGSDTDFSEDYDLITDNIVPGVSRYNYAEDVELLTGFHPSSAFYLVIGRNPNRQQINLDRLVNRLPVHPYHVHIAFVTRTGDFARESYAVYSTCLPPISYESTKQNVTYRFR